MKIIILIKKILLLVLLLFFAENSMPQNPVNFNEAYLLILDVQPQFYANKPIEKEATKMIQDINCLIKHFDNHKVLYVKAGGKVLSISSKGISTQISYPELDSNLNVVNDNIFTKVEGDAFKSDSLYRFLNSNNAKHIVLVGLMADKCVFNTSIGGLEKNFHISIVPRCTIAASEKKKHKAIEKMKLKGVEILLIDDLIR